MTDPQPREATDYRRWRVWCAACGRPCGRHQWGANRGKPIAAQHPRSGAVMPRGLRPAPRGAWVQANACPGSFLPGRRVTLEEEAALASAAPSAETLRRLLAFEDGEAGVDEFRRAMRRGATAAAARRALGRLVDVGLAAELDGAKSRWRLTEAGRSLRALADASP